MDKTVMRIRYVGGPTAVIEVGGVRLLSDPTFDEPGEYPIGDRALVKQAGPAVPAEWIGPVDAVLLSHDQHPDNLDRAGRAYLATPPLVLSTIAERLGPFDVAVLHAGAARTALLDAYLTLTSQDAVRAAQLLGARHVVPLHFEHWAHFTEGAEPLTAAFDRAGLTERLHLPKPGELIELTQAGG
jgi:L-ascorbate metabolism protein UlaG (beta-lactamase superfamily)